MAMRNESGARRDGPLNEMNRSWTEKAALFSHLELAVLDLDDDHGIRAQAVVVLGA